jgi:hypothetical protein
MNRGLETYPSALLIAFALVLLCLAHAMAADKNEPAKVRVDGRKSGKGANGNGDYVEKVPEFSLKDPLGVVLDSPSLYAPNGMLIMLTVPNLTQYEKQKQWEKAIAKMPWPAKNAPRRVLLEDLSQQETFKDRVRSMMAEKYNPQGDIKVIVDEDGAVRRSFGVQQNETVILLVDAKGHIIHHEADYVEADADSARRLMGQVRELSDSMQRPALAPSAGAKLIMADILPVGKN